MSVFANPRKPLLAALAVVGASLAASPPAVAAGYSASYVQSNYDTRVNLRLCPDAGCLLDGRLINGTRVRMVSWCDWAWASGNYGSRRWYKITDEPTSLTRWVHSSFVINPTEVPNRC